MPYLAVIALQVVCIVHLMRTGRNPLRLTALIFLPVVSALAYLIVEVLPGLSTNRHVRTARANVVAALDPERQLRAARDALTSPTPPPTGCAPRTRWRRSTGMPKRCRSIARACG